MASRVEFAVSAIPIYTATNAEMNDTDVIAKDVGHTVGGSGSITVTWGSTDGYSAGVPTYLEGAFGSKTFSSSKFIFLKHSGYQLDLSGNITTTPCTENWIIKVGGNTMAELMPGQAIILPFGTSTIFAMTFQTTSGTMSVGIEYFATA